MKTITAYKSSNGQIEQSPVRAKAHDIAHEFDRLASARAVGTSGKISSKIDWHAAMEILENLDKLQPHLDEYRKVL